MNEAKACPFCGSKAGIVYESKDQVGLQLYAIGCMNKECEVKPATQLYIFDVAEKAWDERVPESLTKKEGKK